MVKKSGISPLLFMFLFIGSFNESVFATRIYGGHYTAERITNLRNNCKKYKWARQQLDAAVIKANPWLLKSDEELWSMVPGQNLPRTIDVTYDGLSSGPKFLGCLVCGNKIFKYGNYPYDLDFENKPWKLTCPSCKSVFPTNDFGKYYRSAIDEHGLFNPAKGDTSLLFNTDHPDPKDPLHKFGVDDGFGYVATNGRAYKFIGYYTWKYWEYINNGLATLADAFLYTGDKRYAHKAAILLDRIADVYPAMDWKPYADRGWYHSDGGSKLGKIEGSIWETGVVQMFADSYDKILSGTQDDPALYIFLKQQSKKYELPKPKGTRAFFVANVDDGILKTAFEAVLSLQIRGNQGMHQLTVATCAIALNTIPQTTQWLDWLFAPDGGAIPGLMLNHFDHDGTSDEGAPGYAFIWGHQITKVAVLLQDCPSYTQHNIFRDFPQFRAAFLVAYRMAALGIATPNMGDAGSTGMVSRQADPQFMAIGYRYTRDPEIAIAAYRANGNSAHGLGLDIYSENPESLNHEIQRIGEKAGPRPEGGHLMSGFGLALLESRTGSSGIALATNYGRTKMHAHPDLLNFDLFAFGHWLAPDHGYPEFATNIPSNTEWTGSTLSHNLVFVNKHPQKEIWGGHTQLFKQLKGFGVFELDGKQAYPEVKDYSRTMLLIGGSGESSSDSNAYVVDIFRVVGGYDHVYSFHGPPGMIATNGLKLEIQKTGTYAGEQIPKGIAAKNFPVGYSFLYNVRKDENPPGQFMLDWKAETGYRGLTEKDDVHLRMYALSQSQDVALADGDPPQNKPGNPKSLGYVLIHRAGTDLNSTFVSVFEPYRNKPFIKSVMRMDDGTGAQVAIKVEKIDGHIDYLLYNPTSQQLMRLPNGISMTGTIGYLEEKDGKVNKGILINGSELKYDNMELKSTGIITGKVVKMDKELDGKGWLLVDSKLPMDSSLNGQQIIIETNEERDASYTIDHVEKEGNLTKVFCGPISFISGFKGGNMVIRTAAVPKSYTQGYVYDFEEGASFKITSHAVWNAKVP
ncbi:MAG TPA: heparinase II/III family protein [Hanamia sp.]